MERAKVQKHVVECKSCGVQKEASITVTGYTCYECVVDAWDPADAPKSKKPTGYPKGWKFMKQFVHENGTVYVRGVEHPDLKGTLLPTPIKVREKDPRSKAQKIQDQQDILVQLNQLRKQVKKETRVTYKQKIETQIKKLEKQL